MASSEGVYKYTRLKCSTRKKTMTLDENWTKDVFEARKKEIFERREQLHDIIRSATEEKWNNDFKEFQEWVKAYYKNYFNKYKTYNPVEGKHISVLKRLALERSFQYFCKEMILYNSDEFIEATWSLLGEHCYLNDPNIRFFI